MPLSTAITHWYLPLKYHSIIKIIIMVGHMEHVQHSIDCSSEFEERQLKYYQYYRTETKKGNTLLKMTCQA